VPFSLLEPESVLDGRYVIIEHLGSGGMGQVYKALQMSNEKLVAIKLLDPFGNSTDYQRFEKEAHILSNICHSNIAEFYNFGTDGVHAYFAMEFIDGVSLRSELKKLGRMQISEITPLIAEVCKALSYAHDLGIVHRDLKPDNIMLCKDPTKKSKVKLIDFGLAKLFDLAGNTIQQLTESGRLVGTVYYLSPEMCSGKKTDHRTDIYALGCILFEALSGVVPFSGESANPAPIMLKHVNDPIPSLLGMVSRSKEYELCDRIIKKAMCKQPEHRYQSAAELRADLLKVLAGGSETLLMRLPQQSEKKKGQQKPFFISILILLALFVTFLAATHYFRPRKESSTITALLSPREIRQADARKCLEKASLYLKNKNRAEADRMLTKALSDISFRFPKEQWTANSSQADLNILRAIVDHLKDRTRIPDAQSKSDWLFVNNERFLNPSDTAEMRSLLAIIHLHSDFPQYSMDEELNLDTDVVGACLLNSRLSARTIAEFEAFIINHSRGETIDAQRRFFLALSKSYLALHMSDAKQAKAFANEANKDLHAIRKWTYPLAQCVALRELGWLYAELSDETQAEEILQECVKTSEKNGCFVGFEHLARFYEEKKIPDKTKAAEWRKKYELHKKAMDDADQKNSR
jgi:serine/threonine protein kinase